ncbi:MAG TPA: ATP-dependent zinc metalloprotease FtsH [Gammaproteobacteria bacterium]|nr:ATP-dependent zinc metalloprotease FtsH [Gammaproteobacteria bacterium]
MAQDNGPPNRRRPDPQNFQPSWTRWVLWLLISAVVIGAWFYIGQGQRTNRPQALSYTAFKQQVAANNVAAITIEGQQIRGQIKSSRTKQPVVFTTTLPPISDPGLMKLLEAHNVTIRARSQETSIWTRLAIGIIPWVLLIALFWWGSKKMRERMGNGGGGGGLFGMGKSRAKRVQKINTNVTLGDVAGCENAKRDVKEIIDFLKEPERFHKLGAKLPKGILLMGPPGTGKTLLSKAVAGEADVPFFSISGSEFVEMFVGVGASRVRDMFKQAKNESPSIIFIDEIDSIGRARGAGLGGGHDEREQTLNQILSEMDGFSPREAVIVMAATNRPDVLDPALMRPGRFDRKITFELPARAARLAILKTHGRKLPLADDVDFEGLAGRTVGMSGADLANLVNEAAMLAGRERHDVVHMSDFDNAYNRIVLGAQREELVNEDEKRVIAFHESGHTLIAMLLKHTDPVNRVTIIPRGRALGATQQTPERDRYNLNESYLKDRMCVMLGGRGAEKLMLGEVSTGAAQDLKQATQMARRMISNWGMSERIGPSAFIDEEDHVFLGRSMGQPRHFSEDTARVIDEETRKLMNNAERIVDELLEQHRGTLERLANALLEKETLEGAEIKAIVDAPEPDVLRQQQAGQA